MEKMNKRRAIQIAIAILTGIVLWLYVEFQVSTEVIMKVEGVPVVFKNEDTSLAEKNMMILSGYDTTIDIELRGPRQTLWNMDDSEFACVADTNVITLPGQQLLEYTVQYASKPLSSTIEVYDASASTVQVTVGELYTKEVDVEYAINGEPAAGFFLGDLETDTKKLVLRAQREDLLNVSYAKVEVNVSGATKTIIQTLDYVLYDYNDVPVENSDIRSATKYVQITLPVRTSKFVPLEIELVGIPEDMPEAVQHRIEPAQVELIGEASTLDAIISILLDKIYVEDLGESQTFTYDVQPPVGTALRNDTLTALVTVTVEGTVDRVVTTERIRGDNAPENLKVELPKTLDVTIWGLESKVAEVKPEDISIRVDMITVNGPGTFTLPANVTLPNHPDVTVKGTYSVVVTAQDPNPEKPGENTPPTTGGTTTTPPTTGGTATTPPTTPTTPETPDSTTNNANNNNGGTTTT